MSNHRFPKCKFLHRTDRFPLNHPQWRWNKEIPPESTAIWDGQKAATEPTVVPLAWKASTDPQRLLQGEMQPEPTEVWSWQESTEPTVVVLTGSRSPKFKRSKWGHPKSGGLCKASPCWWMNPPISGYDPALRHSMEPPSSNLGESQHSLVIPNPSPAFFQRLRDNLD